MENREHYQGREQTLVKHFILRKYLQRLAFVVGTAWDTITYVDGFSGPWNTQSDRCEDSSFAIALDELRKARSAFAQAGRDLRIRCLFLERDPQAYRALESYMAEVHDAEVLTVHNDFEDAVPDIVHFVEQGGREAFPFVFIDPTGWTGFGMAAIAPLLRLRPGEVLINFMTGHIKRFATSLQEQTQQSFEDLFGSSEYRERIQELSGQDREDALVDAYRRNVMEVGGFAFSCAAVVLHPQIDRTHFHLIYGTRHPSGVKVFKDVERQAMDVMERARAAAQQREREAVSEQTEMFESAEVNGQSHHYMALRDRYLAVAESGLREALRDRGQVGYDEAWASALAVPMVWESDLKSWISEWVRSEELTLVGMRPRQRVPKRGEDNTLIWQGAGAP